MGFWVGTRTDVLFTIRKTTNLFFLIILVVRTLTYHTEREDNVETIVIPGNFFSRNNYLLIYLFLTHKLLIFFSKYSQNRMRLFLKILCATFPRAIFNIVEPSAKSINRPLTVLVGRLLHLGIF